MPRGAFKVDNRNAPAGTETIYIPGAFLLSATHNLYLSISRSFSPSLSLLFTPYRLGSASLPPSLSLSVFPHVYTWHIAFIPPPFVIHLNLLLCLPSLHLSLYISVLCPAYIPLCLLCLSIIAYERIPCILACFSGLLTVALLSLVRHPRLRINLYIHMRSISRIYAYSVYKLTDPGLLSANHYIQSDVMSVSHMYAVVLVRWHRDGSVWYLRGCDSLFFSYHFVFLLTVITPFCVNYTWASTQFIQWPCVLKIHFNYKMI